MSHTLIGYANPNLICDECREPVKYWHDPDRCACEDPTYNHPCEHSTGIISQCPSWSPIGGCSCTDEKHKN